MTLVLHQSPEAPLIKLNHIMQRQMYLKRTFKTNRLITRQNPSTAKGEGWWEWEWGRGDSRMSANISHIKRVIIMWLKSGTDLRESRTWSSLRRAALYTQRCSKFCRALRIRETFCFIICVFWIRGLPSIRWNLMII